MNNIVLKEILQNIKPLSEEEWLDFEQYFSYRRLNKNEILWDENSICKHLAFLKTGLIYSFHHCEGKEAVTNFYFENTFFYDDYSFITQQSCISNYVALETTELIVIPRAIIYKMYDKYKVFSQIGRLLLEKYHIESILQQHKSKLPIEERYLSLDKEILKRVPQKIIASYLNVTPEHLSSIRKKILRPIQRPIKKS